MNNTCSRCGHGYSLSRYGSGAFCPGCTKDIKNESAAAQQHRQKILSGDPYELPENSQEAREVRTTIRRRYGHNPATKDCQWNHKKVTS